MKNFKAIIFDLDGTLLDSLADIADSMNGVLMSRGYPVHSTQEYRHLVGDGAETMVIRSLPEEERTEHIIRSCLDTMRAGYAERWSRTTKPYEGIPELLRELKQRRMPMAVLSNKADFFTKAMVKYFFGPDMFTIVSGVNPAGPKKPDPSMALAIADELNVEPEQVLFLGDTRTDMETALRAGMFPLGALWGFRDAQELTGHGARGLVEKPPDVLQYF